MPNFTTTRRSKARASIVHHDHGAARAISLKGGESSLWRARKYRRDALPEMISASFNHPFLSCYPDTDGRSSPPYPTKPRPVLIRGVSPHTPVRWQALRHHPFDARRWAGGESVLSPPEQQLIFGRQIKGQGLRLRNKNFCLPFRFAPLQKFLFRTP